MKKTLIFILMAIASLNIYADSLRTLKTNIIVIDKNTPVETIIKLEEALVIRLPDNINMLSGIEIKITMPSLLRNIQGIAAAIYNNIKPAPQENILTYTADRFFFKLLPVGDDITIIIPFESDQESSKGLGIFPTAVVDTNSFPVALILYPATKGLPANIEKQNFIVHIRPLMGNKGYLDLRLKGLSPAERIHSIIEIDGKPVKYDNNPILLEEGLHSVRITGPSFSDIEKTFAIESGKSTTLDIEIKKEYPTLFIQAPDIAMIILDGKPLEDFYNNLIPIKKGKHSIIIKLGDFSITREFEISDNKTYNINMIMDIVIQEE
ncbi:hypothetical protein WKV44_04695 [Spirochaetia bacterium 38H-sp]|uniref:PEGA domain-containing protein n=1 Tax=Rarispira pelagica TaxID=3141764 RepID=A0ABU9UCE4_9SPIR